MKTKTNARSLSSVHLKTLFCTFILVFISAGAGGLAGQAESETNALNGSDGSIIAAIKAVNDEMPASPTNFRGAENKWESRRKQMIAELIGILNDAKSHNLAKCCAAYCLGIMHASDAVDGLAAQISISPPPPSGSDLSGGLSCGYEPAAEALVAIGISSIPAVIRNLAESDDAKVRELSLQVLNRIDGDKDIVQLRLQKALKAEKDLQKQARLQAALKSLSEIK